MTHHQLFIDHRSHSGGHRIQHQSGGEVLGNGDLHMTTVNRLDQAIDIVRSPAELRDNKGRSFVQLDHALQ